MKPAVLAGSMAFDKSSVDVGALKKALTIRYTPMGEPKPEILRAFKEDGSTIRTPRQFGIEYCEANHIPYTDTTSQGSAVKFPRVPTPRPYQVSTLKSISKEFESNYDFLFRARTGWGKTIGALISAAALGRTTLILVDQENLKDQWVDSLVTHFGFTVEQIGIIQGDKCSYEGKAVTIAMVQTLSQRGYPESMYAYFGTVIVDEVHIIGAPTFSRVLLDLPATYRMGVSATPRRRDSLQKLITHNLGKVRVYVEDEHDESAVYIAEHHSTYSEYANRAPKIGRFITEVANDASRNLLIAEAAAYLYDTGRDVLVLGDRIEQLNELMSLCTYLGVPAGEMGLYTGFQLVYAYAKDPHPKRRPAGYERGTEYTPVSLQLISKRSRKADLERIKTTARIIFATYGKFSKGVDEPRLSAGVDASPRSTSEQVQGRILRILPGKKKPIWVTIVDPNSYRSVFALLGRLKDYVKNNSAVYRWSLDRGKEECHLDDLTDRMDAQIRALKSMRIETNRDGLLTLVTPKQQIESVRERVRTTHTLLRRRSSRTGC